MATRLIFPTPLFSTSTGQIGHRGRHGCHEGVGKERPSGAIAAGTFRGETGDMCSAQVSQRPYFHPSAVGVNGR